MNSPEQVHVSESASIAREPTVGEKLAAARQAHNLSLTDVANRLKLSIQQVQALEAGEYDRLPGPVFVRGFARNYARLLHLDPDEIQRAVDVNLPRARDDGQSAPEANIPMPEQSSARWPIIAGIAAVVFLGAALIDVLWPESPMSTAVAPQAETPAAGPSAAAPAAATSPALTTASTAATSQAPGTATATSSDVAAAMPANYQPAAGAEGRSLRFVFEQSSWIQVRDASGSVVHEALYPAGASREITAKPPLALVIGNAPGVRLTYAGKPVDLVPHTRVAVARLNLE